jgi:hypothetical protein
MTFDRSGDLIRRDTRWLGFSLSLSLLTVGRYSKKKVKPSSEPDHAGNLISECQPPKL